MLYFRSSKAASEQAQQISEAFSVFDYNGDGKLDKSDLLRVTTTVGGTGKLTNDETSKFLSHFVETKGKIMKSDIV